MRVPRDHRPGVERAPQGPVLSRKSCHATDDLVASPKSRDKDYSAIVRELHPN